MPPFVPEGDQARWRMLYDVLTTLQVDDVLTYERMGQILDLDSDAHRQAIQMAFRRASQEFETVDKHAVEAIRNVGYRVVEADQHVGLARQHQRRAGRQLIKGKSKIDNVDLNEMSPDARALAQVMAQALAMQVDMNRRLSGRQDKIERTVAEMQNQSDRTEVETAELRARLERLEKLMNPTLDES